MTDIRQKLWKTKGNITSFFQVTQGSKGIKGRKEREIKISKSFLFIFILTYIILGFFPGCFLYPKAGVLFVWVISVFFVLLTLFPFFRFCSRLPPDKRGQLTVYILSFCNKTSGTAFSHESFLYFCFCYIKIMNPFFLSVSFPRTRREVPSIARR